MEPIAHFSLSLMIVLSIFGAVTLCWIILLAYRTIVGRNEETDLIIDKAEAHLAKEQHDIGETVEKLDKPIRVLGITAGLLAVISVGLWLWEGFSRSF
jgi:hypothetical protein